MLESKFKIKLIKDIENLFPGCIVIHIDPSERQGYPDLLILHRDRWAALEVKRCYNSSRQPNQEYYVDLFNKMSYASFIFPENKEEVLYELQQALRSRR